jgi:hypothetical protein
MQQADTRNYYQCYCDRNIDIPKIKDYSLILIASPSRNSLNKSFDKIQSMIERKCKLYANKKPLTSNQDVSG